MLRRLILLLFFLSLLAGHASAALTRYSAWCENGNQSVVTAGVPNSTTKVQRSYPGCTVTVYIAGTVTVATIYADNNFTPLANPFTANTTNGAFYFYGAGKFDVTMSGAGIGAPFTIGDIKLAQNIISVLDYGAQCNGTTDDLSAIQAALDANPTATIDFPANSTCLLSNTLLLSSKNPLRRFGGHLKGNGVNLIWTNNGTSADTDATMQVGIGAYNRFADPTNQASELGGVIYVEIEGFNMNCPDWGACIFLGNSQENHIHDNQFGRTLQTTAWPPVVYSQNCRHGIAIDGDYLDVFEHNYFACGRISGIGIIASYASPVRVTYDPTVGTGYFNDYPRIIRNQFGNSQGACAILDMGTNSFETREIRENYSGVQGWTYCSAYGESVDFRDNNVESGFSLSGHSNVFGHFLPSNSGNIPMPPGWTGTQLPYSYFSCPNVSNGGCGALENTTITHNQMTNPHWVFYAEEIYSGRVIISQNISGSTDTTSAWVVTPSTFYGTVEFRRDNTAFGNMSPPFNVSYPTSILNSEQPNRVDTVPQSAGSVCLPTANCVLTSQQVILMPYPTGTPPAPDTFRIRDLHTIIASPSMAGTFEVDVSYGAADSAPAGHLVGVINVAYSLSTGDPIIIEGAYIKEMSISNSAFYMPYAPKMSVVAGADGTSNYIDVTLTSICVGCEPVATVKYAGAIGQNSLGYLQISVLAHGTGGSTNWLPYPFTYNPTDGSVDASVRGLTAHATAVSVNPVVGAGNVPACTSYTFSIASGGHLFVNGVDQGITLTGTYNFFYFSDPLPANAIVTGLGMRVVTPFTATGLTSMVTNGIGDGLTYPLSSDTWYAGGPPYNLMSAAGNENHVEYPVFKRPINFNQGWPYVSVTSNQSLATGSLTGSFIVSMCWAVSP